MLKKDITFIYMDSAEKSLCEPIAAEAEKRGYKVRLTNDKYAKCEIGVYCQHVNFPQYSKFSVIMLHDIIQQYGNWPDIWMREPWNIYDVGILPSDRWVENWRKSSQWYYSRPKLGVYKVGWPKADSVAGLDLTAYKKTFNEKYGLDPTKKTVLYAPSWENDHKQDDFVQAMRKLDVNILIKQYNATPELFPLVYYNMMEMYELHKDLPGVTILDPKMNIFDAIMASDVLVSDESSTMCEAAMMGIPAVSVSNWLIPDTTPARYPECNYDFVYMTKKETLTECVADIVDHYESYRQKTVEYRDRTFCNMGKASAMIMDIIDDAVEHRQIHYHDVQPQARQRLPIKRYLKHKYIHTVRNFEGNYCKRYKAVSVIWEWVRKIKKVFYKEQIG